MKLKLQSVLFVLSFIILSVNSFAQMPQGWWTFDNPSNLTAAVPGYGSNLELTGTHEAVAGPYSGNGAVRIGVGSYYKLTHGFSPNGGGTKVNRYSLMFDFKVSTISAWHTFYQTDIVVTGSDGDFFKNTSGMLGTWALGYSTTPVAVDTWYRLVITVDNGNSFKSYLNGSLLKEHTAQAIDDRWALDTYFYLFGDDDGDDGEIDIAEVGIWNYPLTSTEVAALGTAGNVLPVELTSFTAYANNNVITLNWSTATELNNNGFEIQRKDLQNDWRTIGFVKGNGTTSSSNNYSFVDRPDNTGRFFYRLKQLDFNGYYNYSEMVQADVVPNELKLYNNYPNPFNPSTIISYSLSGDGPVNLKVYNSIGQVVADLVNEHQTSGYYQVQFDAAANGLSSGVYFAELRANENVKRIKMILTK